MGEATASVPCITSCHAQFDLDPYIYPLSLTPEMISWIHPERSVLVFAVNSVLYQNLRVSQHPCKSPPLGCALNRHSIAHLQQRLFNIAFKLSFISLFYEKQRGSQIKALGNDVILSMWRHLTNRFVCTDDSFSPLVCSCHITTTLYRSLPPFVSCSFTLSS